GALAGGRIDDERLSALLAETLPQAVDGPEARDWIAEHDMIDRGLLEKAGAGVVRPLDPAAVRGRRDRVPAAGRGVLAGPRARAQRRVPLQGQQQDGP